MDDILNDIKHQAQLKLGFEFSFDWERKEEETLHIMLNSQWIYILKKIDDNSIIIHSEYKCPPGISMELYLIALNMCPNVNIGADFKFDPEKGFISITYHDPVDPNTIN